MVRTGLRVFDARCFHRIVADFVQRRVLGMVMLKVGVVARGVVTKQNRPPALVGSIGIGPMHHIRMKKQTVTRVQLGVDQFHCLAHFLDPTWICAHLLARQHAVIHTPGHASNHLCFLLEEEKTLFTGDHVMQGSTVVINPPDGDMRAYCASMEKVIARNDAIVNDIAMRWSP